VAAWAYGYIYLCTTIVGRDAGGDPNDIGPTIAIIRTSDGFQSLPYTDSLPIMDALGAKGWIIGERIHYDTGAPPLCDGEIRRHGYQGWGYTSYFIRRRKA
jgi:hypothetical protein